MIFPHAHLAQLRCTHEETCAACSWSPKPSPTPPSHSNLKRALDEADEGLPSDCNLGHVLEAQLFVETMVSRLVGTGLKQNMLREALASGEEQEALLVAVSNEWGAKSNQFWSTTF